LLRLLISEITLGCLHDHDARLFLQSFRLERAELGAGGCLKGPNFQRPENSREWAMAYVDGKPIPLPEHWFIGGSHPTFLTPPLPNDYTDAHTWNHAEVERLNGELSRSHGDPR
jgi:hypothetical protein